MDLYQNLFHTPELPYAARKLINRLFFRSLAGYLVLDAVVFLFFSGVGKAWWLLLAAEVVALLLGMQIIPRSSSRCLPPSERWRRRRMP